MPKLRICRNRRFSFVSVLAPPRVVTQSPRNPERNSEGYAALLKLRLKKISKKIKPESNGRDSSKQEIEVNRKFERIF